jgi:predicted acyl esterase
LRAAFRPPVAVIPAPADLRKDHDVAVPMRDGVLLRINLYRPAGDGPFPVILCAHPYGKDALPTHTRRGWRVNAQFRIMHQPEPVTISSETSWEAPDPVRWTALGYAVINADLRGAGHSDGVGSLLDDAEAQDVYDLIEWAGTQSWSTGQVGMLGVSYLALSQYKAAALSPPHLSAICPWEGFTDLYRDFMVPGGVEERGFSRIWTTLTRRAARLRVDLARERRRHPLRDAWWQSLTPDLAAISVPMLVCASFSDGNLHSVGSMRAFEQVGSREKHVYTHRGPKWATFYGEEAFRTQAAFFDRHLRGADVPPLPRVRLEVRESRRAVVAVREEDSWPPGGTRWQRLLLSDRGALVAGSRAPHGGAASFRLRGPGLSFEYAVHEDIEIVGPMAAVLWIGLAGAMDAALTAAVEKWSGTTWVPFEGSYGFGRDRVATGRQRVSLRALDDAASTPGRPVHSFTRAEPLREFDVVPVEIALGNSATLFRRGDRIRLLIAGRDLDAHNPVTGHFPARYAASRAGTCTVHWSAGHPSHLLVPVGATSGG